MKISFLTLFPEMFKGPFGESIIKRAQEKGLVEIDLVNIRDFGVGKHKVVDDTPYGGGVGMVMKVDVLHKAIKATKDSSSPKEEQLVIYMGAHGKRFDQRMAEDFSKLKHLIILCGHYEGIDERAKTYIDMEVSVGDFVLTGGEIPAMAIADAVARLVPGVLKPEATTLESFGISEDGNLLEQPQYTKPAEYEGMRVPEVLQQGNHKVIGEWKRQQRLEITKKLRPDLLTS